MITDEGTILMKRFVATHVGTYGESIGVGISDVATTADMTALQFEVARADVSLISYDFENDLVILKATLPTEAAGSFYEVGLFSLDTAFAPTELLVDFEDDETWDTATWSTTTPRIGAQTLFHTPALSATSTNTISDIHFDLSDYASSDEFKLAVNVSNGNTSTIQIRFMTDASNYYQFSTSTPSIGYHFYTYTKGSATSTGAPDWSEISQIQVRTTSTSGGASQVRFDGLLVQQTSVDDPEYVMVARNELVSPITKEAGVELDIEFAMSVAIA